jgi:hypothetical protein
MPVISTGLVPVHTSGSATTGVPFVLTRFFFREELGRLRVDVTLRSSTGDLVLDVVVFGADEATDATYTLSSTALLTGVSTEGVERMDSFVAVPNDVDGKRLIGVGVRCVNGTVGDVELAMVGLDCHYMVAT